MIQFSQNNIFSSQLWFRNHYNDYAGVNSRLDELQAAFLNVKLPHLDIENEQRRRIARRYLAEIKNDKLVPQMGFFK
jgi:dTDP-4-amino-4,6-dideoxygalactose transaminase